MTKWQKIPLGVVALAVGLGLLLWNGAALADSLITTRSGVALGNLLFFAAGLMGIGGAADLLGPPRQPAKPTKDNLAKSIWARAGHVDQWGIGEN
jgi:hypothetical protein